MRIPTKQGKLSIIYIQYISKFISQGRMQLWRQGDEFAQQNSVPLWVLFLHTYTTHTYIHIYIHSCCIHDIYRFPADRCALQVATAPINKSKCGQNASLSVSSLSLLFLFPFVFFFFCFFCLFFNVLPVIRLPQFVCQLVKPKTYCQHDVMRRLVAHAASDAASVAASVAGAGVAATARGNYVRNQRGDIFSDSFTSVASG